VLLPAEYKQVLVRVNRGGGSSIIQPGQVKSSSSIRRSGINRESPLHVPNVELSMSFQQCDCNPLANSGEQEVVTEDRLPAPKDWMTRSVLGSSFSSSEIAGDRIVMNLPKKDIELLEASDGVRPSSKNPDDDELDFEYVLDLEDMSYVYDALVFDISNYQGLTPANRHLAQCINESRNALKNYFFLLMRLLQFYVYPLKMI